MKLSNGKIAARCFYASFLFLLLFSSGSRAEVYDTSGCGTPDTATYSLAPPIGTFKAVAIYACSTGVNAARLPIWADSIWDSSKQLSVPRYYKDNSLGQYIMTAAAFGLTDSTCFTSSYPVPDPALGTAEQPSGFQFFFDVMTKADDSINFAGFDIDQNDTVDACFFILVNQGGNTGVFLGSSGWLYRTKDTSSSGDTVIISPSRLALARVTNAERAVSVCAHEWGHALFGPMDWGGDLGLSEWGLGAFSIMGTASRGFPQQRAVPVDPVHRANVGWVTPITVTEPLYQETIPDFLTTGTVYKLQHAPTEFFYVTNYRGVNPATTPASFWQNNYSGFGLLIWHVGGPKGIDVELAHGLWNMDEYCNTNNSPNPVSGIDSLDCAKFEPPTRYGYDPNGFGVQSGACFWNSLPAHNKTIFDGNSNPSSHASGGGAQQNISTHLAVRKITTATVAGSPATADLLVNNWYGHITANTTWGPGKVFAITGDITVDAGKTLTIEAGTTVYFQANEDNQGTGADIAKSEIRVDSGGKLIIRGTAAFPVKLLSSKPDSQAGTEDWRGIVIRPGAVFACSNAVIRHAYAGIEDSSRYLHTIKNVRIGGCKLYGIRAVNTDSLTIRSCRVDSIHANPGGYGIYIGAPSNGGKGARLVHDTVGSCYYGMFVSGSTTPVESCRVQASAGWLPSLTGIHTEYQSGEESDTLTITATTISGSFAYQHMENGIQGKVMVRACSLLSAVPPESRSPWGIKNTAFQAVLWVRKSRIAEWGGKGVLLAHNNSQVVNLGTVSSPADSGFNQIFTGATGSSWKYVWDNDCNGCTTPVIPAEWNCWGLAIPPASRFSTNIDYSPYNVGCIEYPDPKLSTEREIKILPPPTTLFQNYPNPFNPTTLIQFHLEKPEKVHLEIFNILGQKVRTMLGGEEFAAGPYTFLWDGKDDRGGPVSSGMYVYKLRTPTFLQSRKMMLVK